jgi:CheY-like chemotaxis protein
MAHQAKDDVEADVRALRRYARALTGDQERGDRYAIACLETATERPADMRAATSPRVALFRFLLSLVREGKVEPHHNGQDGIVARTDRLMAHLTPKSREVLLLRSLEEFSEAEIAEILELEVVRVGELLRIARREMAESVRGRVLVIEDDPVIALDLAGIVEGLGHAIAGMAATQKEAVVLAQETRPDLILADVQLADNSSGIEAVREILASFADMPVIFVTGHPEKLLTGAVPEPAFVIAKPFPEELVRSAVSQAMFFASTATLGRQSAGGS